MNSVLNQNIFLVKEHIGLFKAANNFDIYNPNSKEILLTCREPNLGFLTKIFRFTDYKRMTPFDIEVRTSSGEKVLTVKRGISLFVSTVEVFDDQDIRVGIFKQQFFSIGGKFKVLDDNENPICTLQGKWTSWDFKFMNENTEYAHVTKKWAGIGKELFTSADNYVLEIKDTVPADSPLRILVLAAVLCIDMVLKE
jgi:uncharacterized protein YxjI